MMFGFVGGALAASALAAVAQQRPVLNPSAANLTVSSEAAIKAELQSLRAEIQAYKARTDALEQRLGGAEQAQKTTATKGFELQAKLSNLQTAFDKHQHYSNLVQTTGATQSLTANPTSPPISLCPPRNPATGDSWSGRYSC
jgi:hypothetical protein